MAKKRFTFADAKEQIKVLEAKLEAQAKDLKKKAANALLDTEDNIFTEKELKRVKQLEGWAYASVVIIIGLIAALLA